MKIIHESGLSIDTKNLDLQSNMTRGQDDNIYIMYLNIFTDGTMKCV